MKVKVDKTLVASVALHVLVIGWGLVSFSTKAFESMPQESVTVDVVSAETLTRLGSKTAPKENLKPRVDKVAEAKPVEDNVGKVTDKAPVVTETAPPPQPKVAEKPVEKKPDPPKPVAEQKPKEEPKPEKKQEPPKVDPIAEALKKEEKKPQPKQQQQAAKPPEQTRIKERHYDQSQIAALLDKRDPSRQANTGNTLNSNAALGTSNGKASDNSATWGRMFEDQVNHCWKKPYGGIEAQKLEAEFSIRLRKDGTLEAAPVQLTSPVNPYHRAFLESGLRAIIECAPYRLPAAHYDEWKYFAPVLNNKERL